MLRRPNAMPRIRTRFVCQECGFYAQKWLGRCPGCGIWESFLEEVESEPPPAGVTVAAPRPLDSVDAVDDPRIISRLQEFDRVVGGGIVRGSTTLVAGDPGIGKSTLMSELGRLLDPLRVLYVTGEESVRQVRMRADRVGGATSNVLLFAETNVEAVAEAASEARPDVVVVDSIQTVFRPELDSAPGSVSQIRESAAFLLRLARRLEAATFLVGHVTRTGSIAGPRVLEHLVDTVLYFEGDRHHGYRILRAVKNRFGSTNEIGVFEMGPVGLTEVANPSEVFLAERRSDSSGSSVASIMEGTRPVLVEVQALVTESSYGTPQRTTSGFDLRRLQLLLAVLEKREGLGFSGHDVFLNVAGGMRVDEPAADLAVAVALVSSLRDVPAEPCGVVVGEVGLGGEVRSVSRLDTRLREAAKLGFSRSVAPAANLSGGFSVEGLDIVGVDHLGEALDVLL